MPRGKAASKRAAEGAAGAPIDPPEYDDARHEFVAGRGPAPTDGIKAAAAAKRDSFFKRDDPLPDDGKEAGKIKAGDEKEDYRGNKAFSNPAFRCRTPSAKRLRNSILQGLLTSLLVLAVSGGVLPLGSAASSCDQLGLGAGAAASINAAAATAAAAANFAGLASRVRAIIHGDLGYAPEVLLPSRLAAAAAQLQPGSTLVLVSGACSLRGQMFFDDGPLASALIQHAGSLADLQLKGHALAFNVIPCCWRCLLSSWGCACDEKAWWSDPADRELLSLQTAISLLAYRLEFGVAFGEAAVVLGNLPIAVYAKGLPGQLDISRGKSSLTVPAAIAGIIAVAAPCLQLLGIARVLCNPHPTRTMGAYRGVTPVQRLFWGGQLLLSLWACGWAAGLAAATAPAAAALALLAKERLGLKSDTADGLLNAAVDAFAVASHMALAARNPAIYSTISAAELCYLQICLNAFAVAGVHKLYLWYTGKGTAYRTWVPDCPNLNPLSKELFADLPAHVASRFTITKDPSAPSALFEFDCKLWQIRCLLSSSDFHTKLKLIPSFAIGGWFEPDLLRTLVFGKNGMWQSVLRCVDTPDSPFRNCTFCELTTQFAAGAAEAAEAAEAADAAAQPAAGQPAAAQPAAAKPKTGKGKRGKGKK